MDFVEWLGTPSGIACACLAGLLVVMGIVWFIHWRTALRGWESDTAAKLTAAGVPAWATAPFTKGSQGDIAGAISAEKTALQMFFSPSGQADFDTGILVSAWANPARRVNIQNLYNVLANGGTAAQINAAVTTALAGSPAAGIAAPPTPISVAKTDIQSAVANVQSAIQNANATGSSILGHISDTLTAAGQGGLFPLVAAGAQAQATQAAATASAAAPVVAAAAVPVVAAAAPIVAPAVAAVAAGITVSGLAAGHVVNVSATPGTPAAASAAPVSS